MVRIVIRCGAQTDYQVAEDLIDNPSAKYHIQLRRRQLCQICAEWIKDTANVQVSGLPTSWGPSSSELAKARSDTALPNLGVDRRVDEDLEQDDSGESDEEDVDACELMEDVETRELADAYRASEVNPLDEVVRLQLAL